MWSYFVMDVFSKVAVGRDSFRFVSIQNTSVFTHLFISIEKQHLFMKITRESVPEINQLLAIRIKFLDQGSNGSLVWGSNSVC